MFVVRGYIVNDLPKVHYYVRFLLEHHIGQDAKLLMNAEELGNYIAAGALSCLVLVKITECFNEDPGNKIVGCMIYHKDTCIHFGGDGITLDQFVIEKEYQCKGNGNIMMRELCFRVLEEGGSYIKLTFQDGLGLDAVYKAMGYVNHTQDMKGMHVFELTGKKDLKKLTDEMILNKNPEHETALVEASVGSTFENEISFHTCSDTFRYPGFNVWQPRFMVAYAKSNKTAAFTEFHRKKKMNSGLDNEDLDITSASDNSEGGLPFKLWTCCTYVELVSVCSWSGPTLYMSGFNGDLRVLSPQYLQSRIRKWIAREPKLSGVVFDVPCGTAAARPTMYIGEIVKEPDLTCLQGNPLADSLQQLGVPDITLKEGWNIAYLDRNGMLAFTKKVLDETKSK